MNDWARNRFMAPVYALVISFAVSLPLGAALAPSQVKPPVEQSTETVAPPPVAVRAEFVTQRDDGEFEAVRELPDVAVRVDWSAGGALAVDKDGTFSFTKSAGWPMTICAVLPKQWKPLEPQFNGEDGNTCWKVAEPKNAGPVKLVLIRNGG
jgi:hypothetical protein